MTARCLPDVQSFESDAERVVWQALRDQLPDDAVLWSNLALSDRKGDSEADLVVLARCRRRHHRGQGGPHHP